MRSRYALTSSLLLAGVLGLAIPSLYAAQSGAPADLQWISVKDERIQWLNVADWESKGDGLQPVRVAKAWRDKWPARTAARAQSAAGVTARFRTDSKILVLRVTFIDVPIPPARRKLHGSAPVLLISIFTGTESTLRAYPRRPNLPSGMSRSTTTLIYPENRK
jgi:hypothetical protein